MKVTAYTTPHYFHWIGRWSLGEKRSMQHHLPLLSYKEIRRHV
jgi:hypothetical protein